MRWRCLQANRESSDILLENCCGMTELTCAVRRRKPREALDVRATFCRNLEPNEAVTRIKRKSLRTHTKTRHHNVPGTKRKTHKVLGRRSVQNCRPAQLNTAHYVTHFKASPTTADRHVLDGCSLFQRVRFSNQKYHRGKKLAKLFFEF